MASPPVKHRLGIVLGQLARAGSESQAVLVAMGLQQRGWRVELFSFRNGPLSHEIAALGLCCTTAANAVQALYDYWRWLKHFKPQIIYTFTFRANAWGRLLARLNRRPVLVAAYRSVRTYWFDHLTLGWNRAVICNSKKSKALIIRRYGLAAHRIKIVPNAVAEHRLAPPGEASDGLRKSWLNQGEPVIVMVARLHRHKDHVTALKGFKWLLKFHAAQLVLIGEGPERSKLIQMTQAMGLIERVHFLGHIPGAVQLLSLATLGWLTSRVEGMPNAVLEYMACGLPVVSSRVGGLTEYFEHGREALFFNPGDYRSLAKLSVVLLKDPALATRMIRAARGTVKRQFNAEAAIDQTAAIMAGLIASR